MTEALVKFHQWIVSFGYLPQELILGMLIADVITASVAGGNAASS